MTTFRAGVLGGSFDPIHDGHLLAASEVAWLLRLDRVVFSPTGVAYHKDTSDAAPAEARYRMAVAATEHDPRFTVTRVDIDRGGPTYTVDTLREVRAELQAEFPDSDIELFFILGADALVDVAGWRDPTGILAAAQLVGVTRPGHDLADPGLPPGSFTLVEIPALDISSTDLRRRVREGRPLDYLCPEAVRDVIAAEGLYCA
jgi:nicotinate-nucleotide adenylyltransferase